ncbi:alpha/beta fold hydrolase [Streptantibioticus rubrisoli]|uniref:Alpha/beta hydrolase n=1 Tax=Streptantibioticus rubrisoli TaxID=1387313 RepID=A0ABT1PBL5_9ACTN|nr:alpha/beta fold hydrolase [Streptantibioticus rubrisoli]MCQ4042757.1 alpha/beta hydrolase [Streptantibioticus rubrisoli]
MLLPADQAGQGRTVVLLHARPTDRTMWSAHLPLLAEAGVRAIALDLPGQGEAIMQDQPKVVPWTDVLDTLDHLGIDRFVLAGNSLGALVSLQVAVTARDRVDGLVLVGYRPHDQEPSERLQTAWDRERTALEADDIDAAVQAGLEAWTFEHASDEVKAHAARMLRNQLQARIAHGEPHQAEDPLSQDPHALRSLRLPALVAVGEHDMPDFFRGGEDLAHNLASGDLVVIPGAGHLAPLEQPAAFCALLLDFLDRVPTRAVRRTSGA